MALSYISIPTDYTYADINSLSSNSIVPRPKFIDNSSWTAVKNVEFMAFGYQYTSGSTPPQNTPLYAVYVATSEVAVSYIPSCWLQDGGPSGTDSTHVSSSSSYSNVTNVWHHLESGSITPMQIYVGGGTQEMSTYLFEYDTVYGEESGGGNVWTRSGKSMSYGLTYSISVDEKNLWAEEIIPVQANYVYDITATVQSETNYDGIVLCTGAHANSATFSTMAGWSDCILTLYSSTSGTSTTSSITYTAPANGNLYLYFRTDGSGFYPNPETGRLEISGHQNNNNITITLNDNGGSGGSGTKTVASGTVSGNMGSVNVPTRGSNPAFTFVGYYNTVAYSGGLYYIDSSGNGTNGYTISSAITLYARWSNTISYNPASSLSLTYSTSQQSRTIASTATCASGGTVTYSISSVRKNGTIITNPGFSIVLASNGATTNLIVPASLAVGTYTINIGLTSPNSGSASSNTYAAGSLSKSITVTISAQSNITITFDKNGGSGGQDSVSMAPSCPASQYPTITLPTRGTFRFDGYYNSKTGGVQYFDENGAGVTTGPASSTTMYARWYNTVSYSPSNVSAQTSSSSQNLTVSSTGWSCASGETLNSYEIDNIYKNGTSVSATGWSISSNGKTITIPANITTGTYTVRVALQSKSLTTGSSTYYGDDFDTSFTVTVSESTPQNNAWSNTTSSLIGGTYKRVYTNTQSSPGNIDNFVPGPSTTSEGTSIIELYHDPGTTSNSGVGVGLVGPTVTTSGLGSGAISGRTCFFDGVGVYDFMAQSVNVEPYVGQSTAVRKVYSVHNCDISTSNGVKAVYLGTKSGSTNSVGYYGYSTPAAFNVWASHVSGDSSRKYYAITVNTHKTYDYEEISVQSGKSYIFNMYTDSEALHDGILLTNAIISNPTSTISFTNLDTYKSNNSSTCLEVCHGNKVSKSYSYTPSSNQTLYLYYYTDIGTIKMGNTEASACIGACEVIERVSMTITFNKVGGSNGTSTTTIYSQTPAADYPSITVPTRSGYTFLGYWDSSTANSGTQYFTSTGAGARVWDKTSNTTLYARWENNVSYTTTNKTVYCTSSATVATSTTEAQTVPISSAGCSATTGTCSAIVHACPAGQTWTVTSNGKTLTVPSGVSAGTYSIVIRCTSSAGGTAGSNYYYKQTKDYTVTITVVATAISSYANPTVTCSGGELDAAGETVTLSPSFSQTATWNNNATSTITTGGSYTYTVQTSSTGFSLINTNQVKVTNNTSTSTRGTFKVRVTCSINGKSGYADASFTQEAGAKVYGTPYVSAYTYSTSVSAGKTTDLSPASCTCKYPYTWNGVSTDSGEDSYDLSSSGITWAFTRSSSAVSWATAGTNFATTGKVTIASRGTTTGAARDFYSGFSVVATINGTSTASKTATAGKQALNKLTWAAPGSITHTTPVSLSAAGETYTMSPTISTQTGTYSSGSSTSFTPTFGYAVKTAQTGFSLSSNKVTVTNNTSTTAREGFVVTITASGKTGTNTTYITGLNQTSTKDVTFNQAAGEIVYGTPLISSFTYPLYPASGATNSPVIEFTQHWTWNGVNDGTGGDVISGGTKAFTASSLPTGCSKNSTTTFQLDGKIKWANRGTDTGAARNANNKINVTVTVNGQTSLPCSCSYCEQEANYLTWGNVSLTVSSPATPYAMNKAGETVAISASATQSATYTSGSTDSYTPVLSYTVKTSKTGYSLSSNSVTVTNNNSSTARNGFVVTVTATGITGTNSTYETGFNKTATSDRTFNQAAGSKVYSAVAVDTYTYSGSVSASGATNISPTIVCKATYTWNGTGSSATETVTPSSLAFTRATTYSWATAGTNFATTGKVTIKSLGTTISNARNFYSAFSVVATYSGISSASKTATAGKQNGNYVTAITTGDSSGGTGNHFSYANITAGATSASPSLSGGATYTFTSGSTKFDSSSSPSFGGTATYTRSYSLETVQNGFTAVNSTSGVLTATSRGTTPGEARTSGTVTGTLVVKYTHASSYSAGGTVTAPTYTSTATCTQAANALTNLSISVGTNPIDYGDTSTCTVTATYTSGATKNVDCDANTTYSFNPTGIVTVTKS